MPLHWFPVGFCYLLLFVIFFIGLCVNVLRFVILLGIVLLGVVLLGIVLLGIILLDVVQLGIVQLDIVQLVIVKTRQTLRYRDWLLLGTQVRWSLDYRRIL